MRGADAAERGSAAVRRERRGAWQAMFAVRPPRPDVAGSHVGPASSWLRLKARLLQLGYAQRVSPVRGAHAEGCPEPAGRVPARVLCAGLLRGGRAPAARVLQQHHAAERACAVPARGVKAVDVCQLVQRRGH